LETIINLCLSVPEMLLSYYSRRKWLEFASSKSDNVVSQARTSREGPCHSADAIRPRNRQGPDLPVNVTLKARKPLLKLAFAMREAGIPL
jgi:hypothetical protein